MRLYHGSNQLITKIDLTKCKPFKDFGKGFYMTADYFRAVNMARRKIVICKSGEANVVPYIFNRHKCPKVVNIKVFDRINAEWALFILNNRDKNQEFHHDYDIVIGPVADSRTDPVLEEYKRKYGDNCRKTENLRKLAEELRFPGKEYIQYCFCTEKGVQQLILDL